ncbi:early endosome antigen 1-like [Scophthalmus maximus]|uniref:early endosome antigen 1-like n=1 Tax=Scophthalmus maximus TaxID=52904 RepID=UPI0015E06D40|nr:early endosome antigen 1-like [Scophthalmus maximus]
MALETDSDVKEKSLYQKQIGFVGDELERCQLKCDELNKRNKDLVSLLTALEEDKEDIAEYLIAKEAEEEKKVEEFAELLQNQQQAAERDVVALRLQHGEELPELSDRLQAERTVQVEKLQKQREMLTERMSLEKQLVAQREEHGAEIQSLTTENEEVAEERQTIPDDCVEPPAIQMMLHRLEVMEEIDNLREREREATRHCDMDKMRTDIEKVTRRILARTTEAEQLTKKCKQLEAKLNNWSVTHECSLGEEQHLRQRLAPVSEACGQKLTRVAKLVRQRSRRWLLQGDMKKHAHVLRDVLTDSDDTSETRHKTLMLLDLMESTAHEGTGPAPQDPTGRGGRGPTPERSDSESPWYLDLCDPAS